MRFLEKAALLHSEPYLKRREYWDRRLKGYTPKIVTLQTNSNRLLNRKRFVMDKALQDRLLKISKGDDLSLFILLLSGLNLSEQTFQGKGELFAASPLLHFSSHGAFNDAVLFRSKAPEGISYTDYLYDMKETIIKAYQNQDFPIRTLYENCFESESDAIHADYLCRLDTIHGPWPASVTSDWCFSFEKGEHSIDVEVTYYAKGLEHAEVDQRIEVFFEVLAGIPYRQLSSVEEINKISVQMKTQVLTFSHGYKDIQIKDHLIDLFEAQTNRTPKLVALWSKGVQLTYQELNSRAERVAQELIGRGIGPGSIVALEASRSAETIIGILGILKTGCAYTPIDFSWPSQRILEILEDSRASMLLFCGEHVQVPEGVDCLDLSNLPTEPKALRLRKHSIKPNDLCYVIYTSGSTGKPKGVMIEHRNVVHLIAALRKLIYQPLNQAKVACVAPFYFDASVQQVFASLILGHSLYLVPDEVRLDGDALWQFYNRHGIDISDGTPMHLQMLSLAASKYNGEMPVRNFIIGGEAMPSKVAREFFQACRTAPRLINVYGPTECCVDSTAFEVKAEKLDRLPAIVPIGRPLLNQSVYILDDRLNLQPIGAPGEIYIGGSGVSRGYLNLPELTAERFINDPFSSGSILYRTGDVGKWLPGGDIEYLGRVDHQVKINGYRIEFGDVEQTLQQHPEVMAAVATVLRQESGSRVLAVYYTSESRLSRAEARMFLEERLPGYMVPQFFTLLDRLPVTPNGKIDRIRLPMPNLTEPREIEYEPPATGMEQTIATVWSKVLEVPFPGRQDSFFHSGGDSLKALRMIMELNVLGISVKLNDIFNYQTIRELAYHLDSLGGRIPTGSVQESKGANSFFLESGISGEVVSFPFDSKTYTIWLIEDGQYQKCLDIVRKQRLGLSGDSSPHYIIPKSQNTETIGSFVRSNIDTTMKDLVNQALQDQSRLETIILEQRVADTFNVTPIQKVFLASDSAQSGTVWSIEHYLGEDSIKRAVALLISDQVLLRSRLHCSMDGEIQWVVHENPEEIEVPFADLSGYSLAEQKAILPGLISDLYYRTYKEDESLLYRILLVKLNLREYALIVPCHHAVFDGMSGEVMERAVQSYLASVGIGKNDPVESTGGYRNYGEQIRKGPNLSEQEIIAAFGLKEYDFYASRMNYWLKSYVDKPMKQYIIEAPLPNKSTGELAEYMWHAAFEIVRQFARNCCFNESIPILLYHYGRRYEEKTFYDTVGSFIDVLPMVLGDDPAAHCADRVRERIKLASEGNIHFTSFLLDENIKNSFARICKLIQPCTHSSIMFNYHGKCEEGKVDFFNLLGQNKPQTLFSVHQRQNILFKQSGIAFDMIYTDSVCRVSLTCPFTFSEKLLESDVNRILHSSQFMLQSKR